MLLLSQWLFLIILIILTYNYYEIMSACQKSLWNFFDRAYPPSILKAFKILLRPKALIHQGFLRRFIQFEAGLFLAAARSRHGSDMPPACHSLPCRRFATLKLPCCSVFFTLQHGSFDSLTGYENFHFPYPVLGIICIYILYFSLYSAYRVSKS